MTSGCFLILAGLVVGTWNGEWFPSGRAEHRAHPEVEAATIRAAGNMLREGLASVDPAGTDEVILCLNEIRDRETAEALVKAIRRKGLRVAAISAYRRRDRFDQQQDVILTTLPVAEGNWSLWKASRENQAPRGYAHAEIVLEPAVTAAVYAVHLKSNYGATTDEVRSANTAKRTAAIGQLVSQEKPPRGKRKNARPVIIAGDFNADRWSGEFASEKIFRILEEGGFTNVLALAPPEARGTCPNRKWGDKAYDYIMIRGLEGIAVPKISANEALSDHNAVFVRIDR